jgi:hypothetical protein
MDVIDGAPLPYRDGLLPLPERFDVVTRGTEQVPVWTAEDLRAYAAACVAAERERCVRIVEAYLRS